MSITDAAPELRTAKAVAKEFLWAALAAGPVPATDISHQAREHGLTAKALRSARLALGVAIARQGFGPGSRSVWSLPGPIGAQPVLSEAAAARASIARGASSTQGDSLTRSRLRPLPPVSSARQTAPAGFPESRRAAPPATGHAEAGRISKSRRPKTKDGYEV